MKSLSIERIGVIRSEIKNREGDPLFYTEGAPNAQVKPGAHRGGGHTGIVEVLEAALR